MSARGAAVIGVTFILAASGALAQAAKQAGFEPQSGQAGKDVVWVPTPDELVQKMLDMAKVTKQDFVIDLGSGDGRTVIAAARRGARAQGIEYNPEMVSLSQRNAEKAGVTVNATFAKQDLFQSVHVDHLASLTSLDRVLVLMSFEPQRLEKP